jgi:ABC-type multidrug transport system fused ATPase/permease subunit
MPEKEEEKKSRLSFSHIFHSLRIYRFILPYKWQFIVGMICLVISSGIVAVVPGGFGDLVNAAVPSKAAIDKITKEVRSDHTPDIKLSTITQLIDQINPSDSPEKLKHIGLLLGIVLLVMAVLSFFRIYLFEYVGQRSMAAIRSALYERIITLPIQFFEENRVGNLTSRISADVSQLQDALTNQLAFFVRQLVLPIVCVPILLTVSVKLTLIILALLPVLVISAVIFGRYIRKISRQAQDRLAESVTVVEETFHSTDIVKAYTNEAYETRRYAVINDAVAQIGMYAAKYRAGFVSFIIFAMFGAIVFIVYTGLNEVANHNIQIGQLIEFFLLTIFIGSSLAGLSESYTVIQKTIGASERINEILDETSEVSIADESLYSPVSGRVEFRNVAFSYPTRNDIKIFSDMSFTAQSGEKVALVGPSGSGKSTIIKLLSGFYPFQSGDIIIDGKSIRDYNLTALRKNIGMVPQEVILFGGTIRENIAYGKTNATDAEIVEAAKKANAWDFISSFPEGLDTMVGERGLKLSGGQKQRVAIARAILRDPKILILDEATSALDSESERLVKDALDKLMHGRTTFIIAHRLSTIRQADKILVINKGKIVEEGNHEALMNLSNGLYANLLKLQYEIE